MGLQPPPPLRETDAMLHQERTPKKLVGCRKVEHAVGNNISLRQVGAKHVRGHRSTTRSHLLAHHHVCAVPEAVGMHPLQRFREELVILVHEEHILPLSLVQADVAWSTGPAGVGDPRVLHARLCFCQPPQSFDAAIRRTVIYEHQLDLIPSKGLSKNGGQNPLDEVPRIEDGNDDADLDCHTLKPLTTCLLYTSDAADDLLCVDLGGRRIIKK